MYTKEYQPSESSWYLLDPEGDMLVEFFNEDDIDIILSHLNRA